MNEQKLTPAQEKKAERTKLFEDVYSGVIPKRVPIVASMTPEAALEYSDIPVGKTIWDLDADSIARALDKVCEMIPSDTPAVGGILKNPAVFKLLGSRGYSMGQTGYMQHVDLETLKSDEYDEFIKDPFAFIVTKSLPRIFENLDSHSPRSGMALAEAMKAFYDYLAKFDSIKAPIFAKYGYYSPPEGSTTLCQASFDLIGDFLRGIKGIYMDVRQRPEKILEACEAMLPMQVKRGLPPKPHKLGEVFMPLHLGTYLRKKILRNCIGQASQNLSISWQNTDKLPRFSVNMTGCAILIYCRIFQQIQESYLNTAIQKLLRKSWAINTFSPACIPSPI